MSVLKASFLLGILGVLCIFVENYIYQYVDNDGVLHESVLLPVGTILILLGEIGVVFSLAKNFLKIRGRYKVVNQHN